MAVEQAEAAPVAAAQADHARPHANSVLLCPPQGVSYTCGTCMFINQSMQPVSKRVLGLMLRYTITHLLCIIDMQVLAAAIMLLPSHLRNAVTANTGGTPASGQGQRQTQVNTCHLSCVIGGHCTMAYVFRLSLHALSGHLHEHDTM